MTDKPIETTKPMPENHLEGRVSKVETRLEALTVSVQTINDTVKQVHDNQLQASSEFRTCQEKASQDLREMLRESQRLQDRNTKSLAGEIEATRLEQYKRGQTSWPLVVSVILASFVVGGVFVAFVTMKLQPLNQDIQETRDSIALINHYDASSEALNRVTHTKLTDWQALHDKEVSGLNASQSSRLNAIESRNKLLDRTVTDITTTRFTNERGIELEKLVAGLREGQRQIEMRLDRGVAWDQIESVKPRDVDKGYRK